MTEIKRPLKRSLLGGIAIFTLLLCIMLIGAQYFTIRRVMYGQYQNRISNILAYAAEAIDPDDLAECLRTGEKSERYMETQKALDTIKERTGAHYLYVIVPLNRDERDNIRNVIAGATAYEYEFEADTLVELGGLTGDAYSAETAGKYLDAYLSGEKTFFENSTVFGSDYTGLVTLFDSQGNRVAALCVDFDSAEIHSQLRQNMLDIMVIMVIAAMLFSSVLMIWADRNVITPVKTLEESVTDLAEKVRDRRDPDALLFEAPDIHTENEVEALARALEKTSVGLRDHMLEIVRQEKELAKASAITNRDPLTHVGNKNAYNSYEESLLLKMSEGPMEYAVLAADVDGLGGINEKYGHEKGDAYLLETCRVICEIFRHSPVFRLGGDEFAAVLTGEDYQNRTALMKQLRAGFRSSRENGELNPWERCSASVGLAEYDRRTDRTVGTVYEKAEQRMREEKERNRTL